MKNAKKHREVSKKESRIRKFIVIFITCTLALIGLLYLEMVTFNKYSDTSIKMYKEEAYNIYNQGLKKLDYENIKIQTPEDEDMDRVFNQGLKYVVHKDLLNLELETYHKINYKEGEFYFYDDFKLNSIIIIIDPENSDDISYYKYKSQIKLKAVLGRMIFSYACILLYYGLMFLKENQSEQNNDQKEDNTEQKNEELQNEYPKNEDVKKKKNKKKNK